MKQPKKSKWGGYSNRTAAFMAAVENHLKEKFGEIETQWEGLLQMLATNYEIFWVAMAKIKDDGIMIINRFGGVEKHPLLKVMTDAQIQVIKLVAEFGITPKNVKKLGVQGEDGDDLIQLLTE